MTYTDGKCILIVMIKMKQLRKARGMSLKAMELAVGVTEGYLSLVERGVKRNPSREVMEKIASALNSTVYEIFFAEPIKIA